MSIEEREDNQNLGSLPDDILRERGEYNVQRPTASTGPQNMVGVGMSRAGQATDLNAFRVMSTYDVLPVNGQRLEYSSGSYDLTTNGEYALTVQVPSGFVGVIRHIEWLFACPRAVTTSAQEYSITILNGASSLLPLNALQGAFGSRDLYLLVDQNATINIAANGSVINAVYGNSILVDMTIDFLRKQNVPLSYEIASR